MIWWRPSHVHLFLHILHWNEKKESEIDFYGHFLLCSFQNSGKFTEIFSKASILREKLREGMFAAIQIDFVYKVAQLPTPLRQHFSQSIAFTGLHPRRMSITSTHKVINILVIVKHGRPVYSCVCFCFHTKFESFQCTLRRRRRKKHVYISLIWWSNKPSLSSTATSTYGLLL